VFAGSVQAQEKPRTNVEVFGELAVGCLGGVPDTLTSFVLVPSESMPYLRPTLTAFWMDQGRNVFLADSTLDNDLSGTLHRLRYAPEGARVVYEAEADSRLRRTVTLGLAHSIVSASGLLLDDGRCRDEYSDSLDRSAILLVERDPFPEARGEIPPERTWRRWAEPAVLALSVGVVAYLFFSIRSS
jgi:hypothetical protein